MKTPTTKDEFHSKYRAVMVRLARQIPGAKVHSNKGGIAVLGEVYLDAPQLHVMVGGTFWDALQHPDMAQFMYRYEVRQPGRASIMGRNRYAPHAMLTNSPARCVELFLEAINQKA